ncbi:MAG: DUF362 domain-containing protein, partial [Candidatus Micrarchaeota archaeon]
PIMKKHEGTGITLSFKNHFGTFFDTAMHSYMYLTWPDYSPTKNPFVDLYRNPNINAKTVLIVGDALYAGKNQNAVIVRWASFGNDSPNMLLFSADPVAIDSVMYNYLKREPGLNIPAASEDILNVAAAAGLGVHENWNNDIDRDYAVIDYHEIDLSSLQTCGSQGGFICTGPQICNGNLLNSSDAAICCSIPCTTVTPSPSPSPSPSAIASPSPSPSPTPMPTPSPSPLPSPSPTATPTPSPSATVTPIPSPSPSPRRALQHRHRLPLAHCPPQAHPLRLRFHLQLSLPLFPRLRQALCPLPQPPLPRLHPLRLQLLLQ